MTVVQLASKTGVPASTIRYWEGIGVLPKAQRISGQRRYTDDSIYRLAVLRLAQACGFRLEEMRHLMNGFRTDTPPSRRWQEMAVSKQKDLDTQIARLKTMKRVVDRVLSCQCAELADCGRIAASLTEAADSRER